MQLRTADCLVMGRFDNLLIVSVPTVDYTSDRLTAELVHGRIQGLGGPRVQVSSCREKKTSSSAMAERPRELDQRFQMGGGQFEAIIDWRVTFRAIATRRNLRLRTHYMVNKSFLLLGLAAEYRSRRRRRRCANNIAADHQMLIRLTGQLS